MTNDIKEIMTRLESHRLWLETVGEQGEKLGIDEVDLRNMDLSQYPLDQAYITACTFDGMNLNHKDFSSSLLNSSTFISTNLEGADFCKSNVRMRTSQMPMLKLLDFLIVNVLRRCLFKQIYQMLI
ncbi:pentapeptide repeat-containing protein [Paenibacillus amylolyticus]